MAINERLVHTASAAAGGGTGNQEEGLILHLDANDVDSYDGDGTEWVDIANHEYTPTTNVSEHFNTVIYNGNGSSSGQAITGVGFEPDLVWVKKRNAAGRHQIQHSLEDGWIDSSDTIPYAPSQAHIDFRPVSTFDSDGFTIPTNYTYNNHVSGTYVAWCFKAGGAPSGSDKVSIDDTSYATMSAAGLTDGTEPIDKLSVNTKLGFSIVKYTAPALTGDTVAHGLDQAPEMIILKSTSVTRNWNVYHKGVGLSKNLHLNTSDAANTDEYWTANSNTFSIQDYSASADWIAYCFTSKRGVSKVGSYIGNTTTDNKIVTGFEPAFVMLKNTSRDNTRWIIMDNARDPDNTAYKVLSPNSSIIEDTSTSYWLLDWEADGFRLKYGADTEFNRSGDNFIYYAVAKNTNETSLTPTKDNFVVSSISDDLKLHIDIGNSSCYSGTGTTVNDLSSSYHTITTLGGVQSSDFNSSLRYLEVDENANEGLTISDHSDFDHTNGATYEGWVYLDPNGTSEETFFFRGPSSSAQGLRVYWHASYGWFPRDFNASGSEIIDQNNIKTGASGFGRGKWYHLALTLSSASAATYTLYVDGNLIGSYTASGSGQNSLSYDISLGKYGGGGVPDLNGRIGQFRFYGTVLNSSEIKSNYETTGIYNAPDLQLHLDAGDDTTVSTSTWGDKANSNDGTLSGFSSTLIDFYEKELGNYIQFDGTNDKITTTYDATTTNGVSVEMWFRQEGSGTVRVLFGDDTEFSCYVGGNVTGSFPDESLYMYKGGDVGSRGAMVLRLGVDYFNGKGWQHIVLVDVPSAKNKMYLNGEEVSYASISGYLDTFSFDFNNFKVSNGYSGSHFFKGGIGQVRVYQSALTQAQIRQNYNYTKPNYPNGHDGALVGLTSSDWNPDGYFTFDGASDYIELPFNTTFDEFSFHAWVRPDSTTADYHGILGKWWDGSNRSFMLTGINQQLKVDIAYTDSNTDHVFGSTALPDATWSFVCATWKNYEGLTLTVNDTTETFSINKAIRSNTNSWYIGNQDSRVIKLWDGRISECKMYDKKLTSVEITEAYNANKSSYGL